MVLVVPLGDGTVTMQHAPPTGTQDVRRHHSGTSEVPALETTETLLFLIIVSVVGGAIVAALLYIRVYVEPRRGKP